MPSTQEPSFPPHPLLTTSAQPQVPEQGLHSAPVQREGSSTHTTHEGHSTHHHPVCLEGALVANTCLGDHEPRAMALVRVPHANVALTPGEEGGGQS